MISEPLPIRVQDQVLVSLEAARAAASEARRLIAENPDVDGSGLAAAIGRFLNSQADLIAAVQVLNATEPSPSKLEDSEVIELAAEWGEPRDWLETKPGRRLR
jgi:hypothetical protein